MKVPQRKSPASAGNGGTGPDRSLEHGLPMPVAGVDEAGCAPLAGPVVAAAVILPPGAEDEPDLAGLTDSKMLGKPARERLYAVIRSIGTVGVGAASVAEIEKLNIRRADMLAMSRAVAALPIRPGHLLVDGNGAPETGIPVTTIVGGDHRCLSISAASVIAKVTRDRIMTGLAVRHPGYGWDRNAGYPAPDHYIALLRQGITAHHRRTFTPLSDLDETGRPTFGERVPVAEAGLELVFLRRDLAAAVMTGTNTVAIIFQSRSGAWIGRRAASTAAGDPAVCDALPPHLLILCDTTLAAMTPAAVIEALNQGKAPSR